MMKHTLLDEIDEYFLYLIQDGCANAYRIFKQTQGTPYKIAYPNVYKRILTLEKWGVIKAVENKYDSLHGARFYEIDKKYVKKQIAYHEECIQRLKGQNNKA